MTDFCNRVIKEKTGIQNIVVQRVVKRKVVFMEFKLSGCGNSRLALQLIQGEFIRRDVSIRVCSTQNVLYLYMTLSRSAEAS